MFLIYLDESGKPHKTDWSENFTIAGVIVNENSWNEIENKINDLKKYLFGKEWQLYELHMSEILHGNKIYSKFKLDERLKILEKVFNIIKDLNV